MEGRESSAEKTPVSYQIILLTSCVWKEEERKDSRLLVSFSIAVASAVSHSVAPVQIFNSSPSGKHRKSESHNSNSYFRNLETTRPRCKSF